MKTETYTKAFTYRESPISITLTLNFKIGRKPNQKSWHHLALSIDTLVDYKVEETIRDEDLEMTMLVMETQAMLFIDDLIDGPEDLVDRVYDLGFHTILPYKERSNEEEA